MYISFVELLNFRKLKSTHIRFDQKRTLFVGANNSGKTSAIEALQIFLLRPKDIALSDITIGNWNGFDYLGNAWEENEDISLDEHLLPTLDIWLDVPIEEIHHVVHLLPTAEWSGGLLGVRLRFEFDDLERLKRDFLDARNVAKKYESSVPENKGIDKPIAMPRSLSDFLTHKLPKYIRLVPYALDPDARKSPSSSGLAAPQELPEYPREIETAPFDGVIDIDDIPAGRGFDSLGGNDSDDSQLSYKSRRGKRTLSEQIRSHHDHHFSDPDKIAESDAIAFASLQVAEKAFDAKLKSDFQMVRSELGEMNIPGTHNPDIVFNAKYRALEGLRHASAVQYAVSKPLNAEDDPRFLPESYAGLGYQNLISMMFLLIRFREDRMAALKKADEGLKVAPLHLVLIEEPEAHLHAQVQQVFISKAYAVLRRHDLLGDKKTFSTQMMVSTHSSHVAHEVDFACIRYFRRHAPISAGQSATTGVTDLSEVFGEDDKTARFVKRYLKATDCDLFFADAAIFVEGQAERILLPHFIRNHYPTLWQRYTSLIDVGGAHANRFEPFLECLGIPILVVTDIDATQPTEKLDKNGKQITVNLKAPAKKGMGQVTSNSVLKSWYPKIKEIDKLVELTDKNNVREITGDSYPLYIAYQKTLSIEGIGEIIPRTFEDALIAENTDALAEVDNKPVKDLIQLIVDKSPSGDELSDSLFELVNSAQKASFAIQCLFDVDDQKPLFPPSYIKHGLEWLDKQLQEEPLDGQKNSGEEQTKVVAGDESE